MSRITVSFTLEPYVFMITVDMLQWFVTLLADMLFHPGTLRYIVDLTIAYPKGYPLSLVDVVTGYTSACRIYFHYRVFDIKEVSGLVEEMCEFNTGFV